MKLKHNQRITCKIDGIHMGDAKVSYDESTGKYWICQNYKSGDEAYNRLGYTSSWVFNPDDPGRDGVSDIKILDKVVTVNDLNIGDKIKRIGRTAYVQGIAGNVVFFTYAKDGTGVVYSKGFQELVNVGSIIQPVEEKPVPEYTMAEAIKLLGHEFKVKK